MKKNILKRMVVCLLSVSMVLGLGGVTAMAAETSEDAIEEIGEDYGIATYSSSNNTRATARSMDTGEWYQSTIGSSETDYWAVTLPTSGRITFQFESEATEVRVRIDSSGDSVGIDSFDLVGGTPSDPIPIKEKYDLVSGTYYIEVYGFSGNSTRNYRLKVDFTSANETIKESVTKNNNSAEKASSISLNTTYKGQIALNDKYDFYKFKLYNSQDLQISIKSEGELSFMIHRENDLVYNEWRDLRFSGSDNDSVKLSAGTYYLEVDGSYGTGNYSFKLSNNGVCKASDGNWYNYKNGTIQKKATVAQNDNGWWYVDKNGKVDFNYTGFASNSNGKWYVEKGYVNFKKNGVYKDKTGAIGTKGNWYYVTGSKVQTGYTGVANYKNANGWWYIKNGKVDFSANTVAKNKNGWFYVKGGKVDFTANTVAKNKSGWWYIVGGKVNFKYTGVANYKNKSGWWYIKNGKVDFSYTGRAKNKNGTWYVKNGKVQF